MLWKREPSINTVAEIFLYKFWCLKGCSVFSLSGHR